MGGAGTVTVIDHWEEGHFGLSLEDSGQCDQWKEQPCRAEEQRKLRGSPNSSAETCAPGRSAWVRGAGDMGVPAEPREGSDKVLKQSQAPGVGETLISWGAGKALRE